jgi:hypothetical protein
MNQLPSDSKQYAEWIGEAKTRQRIPIIFAGGKPEKVELIKAIFPKAVFCSTAELPETIYKLVNKL